MTADRKKRIERVLPALTASLGKCALCRRSCGVNRLAGERGFCLAPRDAVVYSSFIHHGEEPPISGRRGSGTVFFSHCAARCVYCQNWKFSQTDRGEALSSASLADRMCRLQRAGCHNMNLVNPTHFVPAILEALLLAIEKGLDIPVVYNTGGYDSPSTIEALDGIVDVYLPDMRYSRDEMAVKYSSAPGYVENNRRVVRLMHEQVGGLKLDKEGAAKKGLIVRLLMLPGDISGTIETLDFLAKLDRNIFLSVMSQYYPAYKARRYEELSRRITRAEYDKVLEKMEELGLEKGWTQPFDGGFDPSFAGENF